MSKPNQSLEKDVNKKHKPQQQQTIAPKQGGQQSPLEKHLSGLTSTNFQAQIAGLNNPNMSKIQRQLLGKHMGNTHGNKHLTRVLQAMKPSQGKEKDAVQRMPLHVKDGAAVKTHTLEMTESVVSKVALDLGVPQKLPTGDWNPDYNDLKDTIFRFHQEGRSFDSEDELTDAVLEGLNTKRSLSGVDWNDPNVRDLHPEKEDFLDIFTTFTSPSEADSAWNLTIQGIQQQRIQNAAGRKHDPNQYYIDLANQIETHLTGLQPIALWSGGIDTSLYARSLGYTTLESTQAGKVYDALKLFENFSTLGPLWNRLSRKFVSSMTGEVHIFMRVYSPDSVLFRQELPELNARIGSHVNDVRWHILRNWSHADLKEVNEQGVEVDSHTFNSHEEAVQVMETSCIRNQDGDAVNDSEAGDIKAQLREQLLTKLPHIGEARANAILTAFPTITALRAASMEDIKGVAGIGEATSQKIYTLFN